MHGTNYTDLENPKECQQWKTITNPAEVEFYIRLRNKNHFGQAQGTPFTIEPLQDNLNWEATTNLSNEILQNGYDPAYYEDELDSIPQYVSLLHTCKAVSTLDAIPAEITEEDFSSRIRRWRETTTTSPSGRHLGRYKALFTKIPKPTNVETPQKLSKSSQPNKQKSETQFWLLSIIVFVPAISSNDGRLS